MSHCKTFALYGKKKGNEKAQLWASSALLRFLAGLFCMARASKCNGREEKQSWSVWVTTLLLQDIAKIISLNTEDEQGLEWKRKLMVLKNYSCWSCMTKIIWHNHSHTPIYQCCFWKQQHWSFWQPSAPVPAGESTAHRENKEQYSCPVHNSQRTVSRKHGSKGIPTWPFDVFVLVFYIHNDPKEKGILEVLQDYFL